MSDIDEIKALLNTKLLQKLYTSLKDRLYLRPPSIHIFVTEYNAGNYLEDCLNSILKQKVSAPYNVYVVDDLSTDDITKQIISTWRSKGLQNFFFIENEKKEGKAVNLLKILGMMNWNPEDICVVLDGDDSFIDETVLEKVVSVYQETGCWVTYGSYQMSNGNPACCARPLEPAHFEYEKSGKGLRNSPWVFSHLFTAKAHLWHSLDKSVAYHPNGTPLMATSDMAFNYSIVEFAGCSRIQYMSERLVHYNIHNPINDYKIQGKYQEECERYVRSLTPYKKLETPKFTIDNLVVFGVNGRREHLHRTYYQLEIENGRLDLDKRASVMVVEHSPAPEFKTWCKKKGIAWLWIPLEKDMGNPLGQFNRSLGFDMSVLYGPKTKNYLFMDSDLLVPHEFWKKLGKNIKGHEIAIQPFAHRAVFYMTEELSRELMKKPNLDISTIECVSKNGHFGGRGAKGGATYMSYDNFMRIGGFDPQIFWGYAPEDQLFWRKMEAEGGLGYADEPAIDLLHLWHPPAVNTNPYHDQMSHYWVTVLSKKPKEWYNIYNKSKSDYLKNFIKFVINK